MQDIIRVGMIGCGGIANKKHLPSLEKIEGVEVAAFYDTDPGRARATAERYGCPNHLVCGTVEQMLNRSDIDAVHICTPNNTHASIAVEAMRRGKHVMCEKPMDSTVEGARAMVKTAAETGRKLTVACQNRFRADSLHLRHLCQNGELGDIYFAKAHAVRRRAVPTWGTFLNREIQGGGPLVDIGIHALDLTLWTMDNFKPRYAVGTTYHEFANQTHTGNAFGDWKPEDFTVEDSAFGFVVMENGATVIIESSWALNTLETGEAKTTLCGTRAGADMWNGLCINGCEYGKLYTKQPVLEVGGVDFYDGETQDPGYLEAKAWIDCIRNDTEPFVRPEEALAVSEILHAVYTSAQSGQPYYFSR